LAHTLFTAVAQDQGEVIAGLDQALGRSADVGNYWKFADVDIGTLVKPGGSPWQTSFEFTHIKGPFKNMAACFRGFEAFKMVEKGIRESGLTISLGSVRMLFGVGSFLGV
jgi:hypothetical protein